MSPLNDNIFHFYSIFHFPECIQDRLCYKMHPGQENNTLPMLKLWHCLCSTLFFVYFHLSIVHDVNSQQFCLHTRVLDMCKTLRWKITYRIHLLKIVWRYGFAQICVFVRILLSVCLHEHIYFIRPLSLQDVEVGYAYINKCFLTFELVLKQWGLFLYTHDHWYVLTYLTSCQLLHYACWSTAQRQMLWT